ncbi:TetR family transcriptional regulator, partial [Escherichia coli]
MKKVKYCLRAVLGLCCVSSRKFGERGYDGTSIQEIAKEAKVNVAMASYYFNGKENLYLEVFKKYGFAKKLP